MKEKLGKSGKKPLVYVDQVEDFISRDNNVCAEPWPQHCMIGEAADNNLSSVMFVSPDS